MKGKTLDNFVQLVIDNFTITNDQLTALKQAEITGEKAVIDFLIKAKILDLEQAIQVKGQALNLPYVNLTNLTANDKVLGLIDPEVANNYQIVAFNQVGTELQVGMVDPQDLRAIEAIEFLAKKYSLKAKLYIISENSFNHFYREYHPLNEEIKDVLASAKEEESVKAEITTKRTDNLEEIIQQAPVAKVVSTIIKHAVEEGVSDIHIEPMGKQSRVRYRVDGLLRTILTIPAYLHSAVVARIKVLANLKLDESRIPQDGRVRLQIDGKDIDFRVSTLPLIDNEKVVLRILNSSGKAITLEQLGFNNEHIKKIEKNIRRPHGMFLITGPTGSGKSTTLYAVLNLLNSEQVNIVTLEDPIEYYINGVNQAQIQEEVNFTFLEGLRSVLRQDPDIIMVGEIRDGKTASMAVHAGLTGHLVLSTIHTNDAVGVIPRLIDMAVEPFLIASTLNIVIAQRLTRRICDDCRDKVVLPPNLEKKVKDYIKDLAVEDKDLKIDLSGVLTFYHGKGCPRCQNSGYSGRVAIAEIIEINSAMQELIVSGYNIEKVSKELKRQGMVSLRQDGLVKALKGLTTVEEVLRATED